MDARLRQRVRERAGGHYEYCGLPEEREPLPFYVEHIVARQHGGKDAEANFTRRGGEIIGLSLVGRTTVAVLRMNEAGRLQLRDG
jgi:hypothetical protein